MQHRIVLLTVLGLALGLVGRANADIAPPLPQGKNVTVTVEVDEKAKGPKLIIPNLVFTPPRVRPFPRNDAPKGELPRDNSDGIAENLEPQENGVVPPQENTATPRNGLLFAGIALSVSMAFGGMWLLRRNGRGPSRVLGIMIAAGAALAVGAAVWANAPPPPSIRERPQPKVPASFPTAFEGKVSVEFTYGAEPVRLILDKESYEKLKKGELKAPETPPTPKPVGRPQPTG